MTVATLLLDINDMYVNKDGGLPEGRPSWDKELLRSMISCSVISPEGANILPDSMTNGMIDNKFTMPITIQEVNDTADMIIVIRAYSMSLEGKQFRLDDYNKIVDLGQIELWFRKD